MRAPLPAGLESGFLVAATELGMVSAARIFVDEIADARGREGVDALRDVLGREFPVVDFVASAWLEGRALPTLNPARVLEELGEPKRLLVVGMEADALDRLVAALPRTTAIGLTVGGGGLEPDGERAAANYGSALEVVPLSDWPRWAGARSALLTFVYGVEGGVAFVSPSYLRLVGPDVRTSFRSLVGWDLLGGAPRLHPRFLGGTNVTDLSAIVSEGSDEAA